MEKKLIAALGAPDPEMELIEELLIRCGIGVVHAKNSKGARVRAEEAYNASFCETDIDIFVECGPAHDERADHHQPGDFGFLLGPNDFMAASSVGQVIAWLAKQCLLPQRWVRNQKHGTDIAGSFLERNPRSDSSLFSGWEVVQADSRIIIPEVFVLTAAGDHCPAAAYAGACHGVSPESLRAYRRWTRAKATNSTEAAVENGWKKGAEAITAAPIIKIDGHPVLDLRDVHVPHMNEVLAQTGKVGLYALNAGREQKVGIVGGGEGSIPGVEPIVAFMDQAPQALGLERMYGNPTRGYAGGFRQREVSHAK